MTLNAGSDDSDIDGNLDVTTLRLIDPKSGKEVTTLVVPGEGTWRVDTTTGKVTFTPEQGFTGDPTDVHYTVKDTTGLVSNQATLHIDYLQPHPPVATDEYKHNQIVGSSVTLDLSEDVNDIDGDLNMSSLRLVHPETGEAVTKVTVPGEGIWKVDPSTGKVTFTPEHGFTGDPSPIDYTIKDAQGHISNQATLYIDYLQEHPPVATDDEKSALEGEVVTIDILKNDTNGTDPLNPTTVMIIDPNTQQRVQSLYVPNEGTWEVSSTTGKITFTPESGFKGDPTPIHYTVEDEGGRISNEAKVTIHYKSSVIKATDNLNVPVKSASPFVIDVLKNGDSFGVNGAGKRPISFTQAKHGRVYLDDGGTPDDPTDDLILYEPEPDFVGEVSFTYTIYDAQGNKSTAVISLNVDCASSQKRDAAQTWGVLLMLFGMLLSGIALIRREKYQ